MRVANSDFLILAGILSSFGGLGIYEGYELHPVLYSQPIILFGATAYYGYTTFYRDKKEQRNPLADEG